MHVPELPTRATNDSVGSRLWQGTLLLAWALWWGGLTFYAGVVVPQGTALFGSTEQGALTRQVTLWHNRLFALWLLLLAAEIVRRRAPILLCLGLLLAGVWGLLLWQHARLSAFLDAPESLRSGGFYPLHARYLWLTTGEWLLGLVIPWWLLLPRSHSQPAAPSDRQPSPPRP